MVTHRLQWWRGGRTMPSQDAAPPCIGRDAMAQPRDALAPVSVQVLGSFQVQQNGTTVTHFRGDKVRALLAYLAVEADQPHTRSKLAGLLWPEQPEEQALASLRQALARLRQALSQGEDPLLVTRQTVQWRDGAAEVDVTDFLRLAGSEEVADLAHAAHLYRGEFLEIGRASCRERV